MYTPHITRLSNIALRAATLASKFLLVFVLARYLEPEELGLYGLITATISYALFLVGLDFYIYTTREIASKPKSEWGLILKSQLALYLVLYAIFSPILLLLFTENILPWHTLHWFIPLLIFEHISQELNRLLVAISKPIEASIVLFLRMGAWALSIVLIMYLSPDFRSLNYTLMFWTAGSFIACSTGVLYVVKTGAGGWSKPVAWQWLISGIKIAIPFLIATLALRGIFTLDRYLVEHLVGLNILGAYVLFFGLANALMSFLDSGVFTFIYPKLIAAHAQNKPEEFNTEMRKLIKQTIAVSLIFSATSMFMIEPILDWIDKPLYHEQIMLYPWIMLAVLIFCISMIPHYGLYAKGKDRQIIISHICGFIVFSGSTPLYLGISRELAVPFGLCTAFSLVFLIKFISYRKLIKATN
ncbi:lipopolysaccharide biosynthesis protein [Pseudomonas sp. VI4.1]|uniref:lipopolysaccharide biosynthesis protein n=1 Tax=Pseudomonas sp. VI4.1 TaxID=1941346 RepID=UPI0009D1B5D4|nr:oligosaccharide flippase family protein [Pseudomonas sp. VI4.1]OPK10882.1 hypothetical protein BZ163_07690 [Pseudomonas sp. VI4.1]